jgi:hypothetical protein
MYDSGNTFNKPLIAVAELNPGVDVM